MSRARFGDLKELERLADALAKFDGIRRIVVTREGLAAYFVGCDREEAERQSALASSMLCDSARYLQAMGIRGEAHLAMACSAEEALVVCAFGRAMLSVALERRVAMVIAQLLAMLAEGLEIRCPHCGQDLTLSVYECARCGARIPGIATFCPYCLSEAIYKRCPRCGAPLSLRPLPRRASL